MTPDPYAGLDLLADVFDDTADAPMPDGPTMPLLAGQKLLLRVSPHDPRWTYDRHGRLQRSQP